MKLINQILIGLLVTLISGLLYKGFISVSARMEQHDVMENTIESKECFDNIGGEGSLEAGEVNNCLKLTSLMPNESKDSLVVVNAYLSAGTKYLDEGNTEEALAYYFMAANKAKQRILVVEREFDISERKEIIDDLSQQVSQSYYMIAVTHMKDKKYEESSKYFNKTLENEEKYFDLIHSDFIDSYMRLALNNTILKKYDIAISNINDFHDLAEDKISEIKYKKNNSVVTFDDVIKSSLPSNFINCVAESYLVLADIYLSMENLKSYKINYNEAESLLTKIPDRYDFEIYQCSKKDIMKERFGNFKLREAIIMYKIKKQKS